MTQNSKSAFGKRAPAAGSGRSNAFRPDDKRKSGRATTFKNARIMLDDHTKIGCIARNVSEDGCMITVGGAENLPAELTIRLDPLSRAIRAKIVWSDDGEAGLKFVRTD